MGLLSTPSETGRPLPAGSPPAPDLTLPSIRSQLIRRAIFIIVTVALFCLSTSGTTPDSSTSSVKAPQPTQLTVTPSGQ